MSGGGFKPTSGQADVPIICGDGGTSGCKLCFVALEQQVHGWLLRLLVLGYIFQHRMLGRQLGLCYSAYSQEKGGLQVSAKFPFTMTSMDPKSTLGHLALEFKYLGIHIYNMLLNLSGWHGGWDGRWPCPFLSQRDHGALHRAHGHRWSQAHGQDYCLVSPLQNCHTDCWGMYLCWK